MSNNSPPKLDRLLNVREVADALGVSEKTVRRDIDARNIHVVRVGPTGRGIRVRMSEVQRYVASRSA